MQPQHCKYNRNPVFRTQNGIQEEQRTQARVFLSLFPFHRAFERRFYTIEANICQTRAANAAIILFIRRGAITDFATVCEHKIEKPWMDSTFRQCMQFKTAVPRRNSFRFHRGVVRTLAINIIFFKNAWSIEHSYFFLCYNFIDQLQTRARRTFIRNFFDNIEPLRGKNGSQTLWNQREPWNRYHCRSTLPKLEELNSVDQLVCLARSQLGTWVRLSWYYVETFCLAKNRHNCQAQLINPCLQFVYRRLPPLAIDSAVFG